MRDVSRDKRNFEAKENYFDAMCIIRLKLFENTHAGIYKLQKSALDFHGLYSQNPLNP